MDYKYCSHTFEYEPTYETVDELPDIDYNHLNRYVYLTTDNRFYISTDGGWMRLGVYPVQESHLLLHLDDLDSTIKAETFNCWIEGDKSNIQYSIEDIKLFIRDFKHVLNLIVNTITNSKFDILGFNSITSATLPVYITDGTIEYDAYVQQPLDELSNISDVNAKLTENNKSGLLLGDPCFAIADALILNETHISSIQANEIAYRYYDSSSMIQFGIDKFNVNWQDTQFIDITGTPTSWRSDKHYVRTNGVDWTTFSIINADEIACDLSTCYDDPKSIIFTFNDEQIIMELDDPGYAPCQCDTQIDKTTALQQSICKLYMFKYDCIEYLKFGYLVNTDEDIELMMPPEEEDDCEVFSGDQQIIYDTWPRFGPVSGNVPVDTDVHAFGGFSITDGLISSEGDAISYNGFSAPFSSDHFAISATISSPEDWDDDPVTLMIAKNGSNTLCAVRTCGALQSYWVVSQWSIVYNFRQGDMQIMAEGDHLLDPIAVSTKWNGSTVMMRAQRVGFRGRFASATTSNLNSSISYDSLLEVDLCSIELLKQFLGPKSMGFGSISNPNTTWTGLRVQKIAVPTPAIPKTDRIIYDIREDGTTWIEYNGKWILGSWVYVDGEWQVSACQRLDDLEKNKMYFNPVTRKLFYVGCNGKAICLVCLPIPEIDYCTCEYYNEA